MDPDADPSKKYHLILAASKENKIKTANNKPLDDYENRNPNINDSSTNDAYDELLTQEEIQDHIDKINQILALERIENYVKSHDVEVKLVTMESNHSSHFVHGFSQHIKNGPILYNLGLKNSTHCYFTRSNLKKMGPL